MVLTEMWNCAIHIQKTGEAYNFFSVQCSNELSRFIGHSFQLSGFIQMYSVCSWLSSSYSLSFLSEALTFLQMHMVFNFVSFQTFQTFFLHFAQMVIMLYLFFFLLSKFPCLKLTESTVVLRQATEQYILTPNYSSRRQELVWCINGILALLSS